MRNSSAVIIPPAMATESKVLKGAAQGAFYLAILALIVSRSFTATISHDENLFIAPGQLLATRGLLPYLDYPYPHMPYAMPFYAVNAHGPQISTSLRAG